MSLSKRKRLISEGVGPSPAAPSKYCHNYPHPSVSPLWTSHAFYESCDMRNLGTNNTLHKSKLCRLATEVVLSFPFDHVFVSINSVTFSVDWSITNIPRRRRKINKKKEKTKRKTSAVPM